MATFRLNCVIEGEDIIFPVDAVRNSRVSDLKKLIQKERELDSLRGVGPHTLKLWKPKDTNPIDVEPEETLVERIRLLGQDFKNFAVKLGPSRTAFSIFGPTQHSREYIHIIVTVSRIAPITPSSSHNSNLSQQAAPSQHNFTATISPSSSLESNISAHASSAGERPAGQRLPSDHSLHKLWMLAREPQPTLFETRPVQRDETCSSTEIKLPLDCMVLKGGDWVWQLQPDSLLPAVLIRDEYVEALQAIMKWFLSINEAIEDAMQVDDAESAPLENRPLENRPLENLFLDVPLDFVPKNRAFVLLGEPGIGKTAFLYVLLVLRLQARLPTIYQSRSSHLFYFADDGVYRINLTPNLAAADLQSQLHQSTWCLIDSNANLDTIPMLIQDLHLFMVQASSPRPHRYAWTDKATRPVLRYFMKSWSLSELLVGYLSYFLILEPFVIPLSRVLQCEVYSEKQIKFFSTHYGTSARSVYANASNPLNYEKSLLQKMANITYENIAKLFREALDLGGVVFHQLISISPGTARNTFVSTFRTQYVYNKFRDSLSNHKLEAAARLYDIFVRNPNTKAPAGFILEDAVNDVFSRGGEWSLVPLMRSNRTCPKYIYWKTPNSPTTPQYLHLGYLGRSIAIDTSPYPVGTVYAALPLKRFLSGEVLQLTDGYYYPSSRSQETFDAFIYESASKTATILQVTTAKSHSVKEGGVKWLQSLGVNTFRYIAVSTPNATIDLPFPNGWDMPTEPSIPEKYLLTVESLPSH